MLCLTEDMANFFNLCLMGKIGLCSGIKVLNTFLEVYINSFIAKQGVYHTEAEAFILLFGEHSHEAKKLMLVRCVLNLVFVLLPTSKTLQIKTKKRMPCQEIPQLQASGFANKQPGACLFGLQVRLQGPTEEVQLGAVSFLSLPGLDGLHPTPPHPTCLALPGP